MTSTRYHEWVAASSSVGEAGVFLIDSVNGLGLLDDQLIAREREVMTQFEGWGPTIDTPIDLEIRTLSHLWVLGGYEVVRILAKWAQSDRSIKFAPWLDELQGLKRRFERLRIPLAKQEPARRYEDTDWALAFPTLVQGHGVAWRVSGDTVISRRGLADGFLDVLKSIRTGGT
jgi:hypothetical protein